MTPFVSDCAQNYIRERLDILARENGIRILIAVESGSRAWGFPSKDSDYDVRFIFARKTNDYLSILPLKDVIETPVCYDSTLRADYDLSGWDIRKTLKFAFQSNATVNEWLRSPIRYKYEKEPMGILQGCVRDVTDLNALAYHYERMTRRTFDIVLESPVDAGLKPYCYALRAACSLAWIVRTKTLPPMDMPALLAGLNPDPALREEVETLIARKGDSVEKERIPRNPILDSFLKACLLEKRSRPPKMILNDNQIATANALLNKILSFLNEEGE